MATNNDAIQEEIEALQAIMLDEVKVLHGESGVPNGVEVNVVPATADNIDEQHVRVTLELYLPPDYPDVAPKLSLRNPRGVDDHVLSKIQQESQQKCEEYLGLPVIYELIEVVRENLTANNTPSCPCAICLHHFTETDVFSKTPCYHYFHSYCLGRYIKSCEQEAAAEQQESQPAWMAKEEKALLCPVCRDPLKEKLNCQELLMCLPPEEENDVPEFQADDPELIALQQRMSKLYLTQKERGGIINLEEEKNKYLLSSNRAELCDVLDDGTEGTAADIADLSCGGSQEESSISPTPPQMKRGGSRSTPQQQHPNQHHRSQAQKGSSGGGHGRQSWRGSDQDYWGGGRGGEGGSGGGANRGGNQGGSNNRGRGGRSSYGNSRFISEHHDYHSYNGDYKSSHVIGNSYGHNKHERTSYENGYYSSGDNRSWAGETNNSSGGGGARRGSKGHGNRGRGRGRGRGPPGSYTPSTYRNSAQDWS